MIRAASGVVRAVVSAVANAIEKAVANAVSRSASRATQLTRPYVAGICVSLGLIVGVQGCGSDSGTVTDPQLVYFSLTLNHRALALATTAPYDTVQLTATPMDGLGHMLAGAPAVTYVASDSSVQVTADGLVTAKYPTQLSRVVATLSVGNVTHVDTAYVRVQSGAPPTLASFTLKPSAAGDSTKMAGNGFSVSAEPTKSLAVFNGASAVPVPVYYTSSDPTTAVVNGRTGLVTAVRPGQTTITAESYAYGIARRDSVLFTITYPVLGNVVVEEQAGPHGQRIMVYNPQEIIVSVGANVDWSNNSKTLAADVIFDDSTAALTGTYFPVPSGSGNIPAWTVDTTSFVSTLLTATKERRFAAPGTYTYHSALYGSTGKVTVK